MPSTCAEAGSLGGCRRGFNTTNSLKLCFRVTWCVRRERRLLAFGEVLVLCNVKYYFVAKITADQTRLRSYGNGNQQMTLQN